MNKSTSPLTLKRAALIAAIGTTVYTFFVPVCRMLFGYNAVWFNYAEHPWCCNAWYIFFSCILMVSWTIFALGVVRDGEHFPVFSRKSRYALLIMALFFLVMSFLSVDYCLFPRKCIFMPMWARVLFYAVSSSLLWYIYVHISSDNYSYKPRWQKGICWTVVVLTSLVTVKQITAIIGYAIGLFTRQHGFILIFREVHYNADWICNWLMHGIPIVFFLLIFFQPIITCCAQRKLQRESPMTK